MHFVHVQILTNYFNSTGISSSMEDSIGDVVMPKQKKAKLSTACSPMETYKAYLKDKYLEKEMPNYGKWPPSISKKYVNLAVIEKERLSRTEAEEKSKALTYGDISKIMHKGDIQLADIATPDEDGFLPKFVLVEGAPGIGKTTFAWKACRKWAKGKILQDYELVILVRLRDVSIRKAICLGDLIQYPRDSNVHQKVIEEITITGGKGVLLLLEGYDELPASLREEESLFRNVIKGDLFDEGTVVVTSRHWASEPFLLPYYDTKRPVSKHIEILGFNQDNIKDYLSSILKEKPLLLDDSKHIGDNNKDDLSSMPKKKPSPLDDIIDYLELNPHIHSMMYIPLNCAIILAVYRNSKKENSPIPTTTTELYSSLIRCLLLRHCKGKITKLTDLRSLPECIKSHFDNIARLAYKGICENDQQIIFTEHEIPSDTLGLMQSSMELHVDIGTEKSFNFLHLTIQEFLAAHHLLTDSLDEQVKLLCRRKHIPSVLLRFLAGLSPLALESALTHTSHPLTKKGRVTLEVIHQMFEANKIKMLQQPLTFDSIIIHPYQYYMLGSVIGNAREWNITIYSTCTIRRNNIQMLVKGISTCKEGYKISLCIQMDASRSNNFNLLELCSAPIILETLELSSNYQQRGCDYHFLNQGLNDDLGVFFNKLSKKGSLISHLKLFCFTFDSNTTKEVESFLMNSVSTTRLTVDHCIFSQGILPGKQAFNNIKMLQVCVCYNCTRREYYIPEFNFPNSLAESLCANDTLKRLVLECVYYSDHESEFQLPLDEIPAEIITRNKSLTELVLCYPKNSRVGSYCTLGKALCENNSLEKLELVGVSCGAQSAVAFASMLKSTSLKELSLNLVGDYFCENSEWIEILVALSSSLTHNRTLLKLCITFPPASIQHCDEVISACAKDSRLHIH